MSSATCLSTCHPWWSLHQVMAEVV